ncbi:MAG: tetratricopeptide repeat protein [Myxococcales bacterium]
MSSLLATALLLLSLNADAAPAPACEQPCEERLPPLTKDEADRRAFELQQSLCRSGDAVSCHSMATFLRTGRGTRQDLPRALAQFVRLCEAGRADSCTAAAEMYKAGEGTPADEQQANAYYEKAIAALDAEMRIRRVFYYGVGTGVNFAPRDLGYQGYVSVIGDPANGVTFLTTLGYELVSATRPGEDRVSAVARAVSFSPLGVYLGPSVIRAGASVDVSYGINQTGGAGFDATGLGFGGSVGGGVALPGDMFHLLMLGRYRWITGPRAGGVFIDVFVSFKPPD